MMCISTDAGVGRAQVCLGEGTRDYTSIDKMMKVRPDSSFRTLIL